MKVSRTALTGLVIVTALAGAVTSASAAPLRPAVPAAPTSAADAVIAGNANNGPVHKVWTRSLSAAACKAVRKVHPKAGCSITVTIDVRITNGPQKPPAGAQVATQAAPAVTNSGYWIYEIESQTASGPLYHAKLQEEVAYHDNCWGADCWPHQGVVWNQWIDVSDFACGPGCTISNIQDGIIGNGTEGLNSWENFTVNCNLNITGNSAGCNAGHGNRLYIDANEGASGGFSF
ncbi:MAG: hypothetical protein JO242_25755 [Streptosporangiaceae bacterium]|nr:hypothetical protein [Streptosporangiaceae bacterium]